MTPDLWLNIRNKSSERSQNRRNDLLILALYVLTAASIIDLLEGKSENSLWIFCKLETAERPKWQSWDFSAKGTKWQQLDGFLLRLSVKTCCLGCHRINKGKSRGFIGAHELLANTVCVCVCLKVLLVKSWADPRTGGPQERELQAKATWR